MFAIILLLDVGRFQVLLCMFDLSVDFVVLIWILWALDVCTFLLVAFGCFAFVVCAVFTVDLWVARVYVSG